eukprot:3480614-Prymnesium_polylepis.2
MQCRREQVVVRSAAARGPPPRAPTPTRARLGLRATQTSRLNRARDRHRLARSRGMHAKSHRRQVTRVRRSSTLACVLRATTTWDGAATVRRVRARFLLSTLSTQPPAA